MQFLAANIRSSSYYIAQTDVGCTCCNRRSRVLALAVPPNHRIKLDDGWHTVAANAFIFHVAELPRSVAQRVIERSCGLRLTRGEDANSYWANHCEHCGAMFSDDELHCEPGGFMPSDAAEAEAICLSHISRAFSAAAAGHAIDPEFFALMRKR
jgi:hypothetical protein